MSRVVITPQKLSGCVTPPPSKSDTHRAIICAALARGKSLIAPFEPSDDMEATIGAVRALGARVSRVENALCVDGSDTFCNITSEIDCLESGSTLRFLIPIAAVGGKPVTFTGHGRLPQRPIGPYLDCLPPAGVNCETEGGLPLKISGALRPGEFVLPGDVSSQFITGLLLALPLLSGDSVITLSSPLQSAGYIDLTIDAMRRFGVEIVSREQSYFVKGNQKYTPCTYKTEGDWSQAAFWLAAGALGSQISCAGLSIRSRQGDSAVSEILHRFGAQVNCGETVSALGKKLCGCEIDASQIPDLVPPIAAVATLCEGRTVIKGAARLRIKESDRLRSVTLGLNALGAHVSETDDGLVIDGVPELDGGTADSFNDHRIVMALSIAATHCKGKVTITGCESINKSYPEFFGHYNALGGCANVIDDR
jgi:3-phosphoshikimate 1-carboxyvinyltransferase